MVAGSGLIQRRVAYLQSLEETLGEIIERFRQMPEIERAILFGSYAAGRRDLLTDLDLLVIMDTDLDILYARGEELVLGHSVARLCAEAATYNAEFVREAAQSAVTLAEEAVEFVRQFLEVL